MNAETIIKLNEINRNFYNEVAPHFDSSRQSSWKGWDELLKYLPSGPLRVLDIGCGNARFANFLLHHRLNIKSYTGFDQNHSLIKSAITNCAHIPNVEFQLFDMLQSEHISFPPLQRNHFNLIAIFGVLHHIPGFENRVKLIKSAFELLSPGGLLICSIWKFMDDLHEKDKVVEWTERNLFASEIEDGDYLLSWSRGVESVRYCHYISESEEERLLADFGYSPTVRFDADGKSGSLNRYLLFRK